MSLTYLAATEAEQQREGANYKIRHKVAVGKIVIEIL